MKTILPPILLLLLAGSFASGQSSFEEYLSTNSWTQHIAFEVRFTGQTAARYEASAQPETWFFRSFKTNGVLDVTGTSEGRLWHVHGDGVVITQIPDSTRQTRDLTDGQVEFVSKKQKLAMGLSFGMQAGQIGSFKFDGDSFTANPIQADHEPAQNGVVHGRVTARESGRIKSLFYSRSVRPDRTYYVRFEYSDLHPFLPSTVVVEFEMGRQRYVLETRYSSILLGITNTPAGGYVPSIWLTTPASQVMHYTNGNLYELTDGKPVFINLNRGGSPTHGGWITSTGVAWFLGIASLIVVFSITFLRRPGTKGK